MWLWIFAIAGFLSLSTLIVPWLLQTIHQFPSQNLRTKYGAKWALVTGGSSGIGLSLCHQLAAQGLNIVLASFPDNLLDKAVAELKAKYPNVEIRSVPVNLGSADDTTYMTPLKAATDDILPTLIFNNAGYIVTGFFADLPWDRLAANYHCNATSAMRITHHFLGRIRAAKAKGCIAFTSSPANIIPSPFSCFYGATKSLVTHFATSLACEVGPEGIDVCVIHPSPVATNFYNGTHSLPTLKMFQGTATGPDRVADVLIRGIGKAVIVDQSYYPISFRLLLRICEPTFLFEIMGKISGNLKDYKYLKEQTLQQNKKGK